MGKIKKIVHRYRTGLCTGVICLSYSVPALASEPAGGVDISAFTGLVTTMLTWFLASMSSITGWILGNPMAATYAAIFLVGCAVAMLFRVLHSV